MTARAGRLIVAMLVIAGGIAAAQTQQPPVFRGGSSLVRVDVTITNRHGEPVTTLTPDDFEVSEDGTPQTVETFKLVEADGQPTDGDDLVIRSPEHAAAEAARDDVRVFLIFWDEYHIHRFGSAIMAREALARFVKSALAPTDLIALMDPLLPTDAIRWTRDRGALAQTIGKLEGRYRVYVPSRSAIEDAQAARRDVERLRSEVTVSALKSAAAYLGGLREGRKSIIFVSEGLPALDAYDEFTELTELVRTANDNNTAIYAVDPRGLEGGWSDELRMIGEETGGQLFASNALERAMRQVVTQASAFYLLGYSSTRNPSDGKFHQIKVRVKRSGLDVHARRGYWAPGAADLERAVREAAAEVPAAVADALATLPNVHHPQPLDFWSGVDRGADADAMVTLAWTARPGSAADLPDDGIVSVSVTDSNGNHTVEAPLRRGWLSFPSSPGRVELRATVRTPAGETVAEESRAVVVPDLVHARLALGAAALAVARTPAEVRVRAEGLPPSAGREFRRSDRLFVRFRVYGDGAADASVAVRLLGPGGAELRRLATAPHQGGYEVDLPLASLALGEYLIAIDAEEGDARENTLVPIRIVR